MKQRASKAVRELRVFTSIVILDNRDKIQEATPKIWETFHFLKISFRLIKTHPPPKKKKKNSSSPEDRTSTLKELQKLFWIPISSLTIHLDSYLSKVSLPLSEFSYDSVTGPGNQEMNESREVLLWGLSLETQRNSDKQSKGVRNEAKMSRPSSTFLGTDTPNLRWRVRRLKT